MSTTQDHSRDYARIFNRSTFLALANGEDPKHVFSKIDTAKLPDFVQTVGDLFRIAFESTRKSYRNEYIYKTAITNKVVFGRHSPRTTTVCVELPVGGSIADIAIYNGTSTAYEIKTELDTPRRLISQTSDYLRAFEYTYIVTHPNLAERYAENAHPYLGVMSVSSQGTLKKIKTASSNLENIDSNTIFRILRKSEFIAAAERVSGESVNLANGLIREHCQKIFVNLDIAEAHKIYVDTLKRRTTSADFALFLKSLPEHLRVLGYATPLSKSQRLRFVSSLNIAI